jgi:N-acetylglutamate synthase-like GNAT family acetyltransferase
MPDSRVHIRRAQRTDFTAVMTLLGTSGAAVPPPDRATLRRFRNLVADLGTDFYLALVDGTLAGLIHVTYARQLSALPQAQLAQLLVDPALRRRGIGSALLAFIRQRARKRGCRTFCCAVGTHDSAARAFLEQAGLQLVGEWFREDVQSS